MRIKQEQLVFVVTLLAVGGLSWQLFSGGGKKATSGASGDKAELPRYQPPSVDRALPDEAPVSFGRGFFSPPRDTFPLPPLGLIEPPREALASLLPPTVPGPEPRMFGKLLRRTVEPANVPDLFEETLAAGDDAFDDDPFFSAGAGSRGSSGGGSRLGNLAAAVGADDGGVLEEDMTPAERAALVEGYRRRYDWMLMRSGQNRFGRIENPNRYGLKTDEERADEPFVFVEVDARTGSELRARVNDGTVTVARDGVVQWGFAETFANEIEVRRLELGDKLSRGTFRSAMDLADECVRRWLEAPRALEIAQEFYEAAAKFDTEDPAPRLGLARCQEAAFHFEDAFETYQGLLDDFNHRAEVHARFGSLEARWLATERAEERMRHAVQIDRNNFEARWTLGRFLLSQGRAAEAIEHLEAAQRSAPGDPSRLHDRVSVRTDLGSALLATADLEGAAKSFDQALNGDASFQRARAGQLAVELLSGAATESTGAEAGTALFELLLTEGVAAIVRGSHEEARDQLLRAVDTDPLRASWAYAALSYLAEVTGNQSQAETYVEEALTANPKNAYALFQKGRLLGLADDFDGAREALTAALEIELDFEEALVALGDMAFRLGRFEDAERYLQRAVELAEGRADVHSLRGMNFLRLDRVVDALESFEQARSIDRQSMPARAGRAWCTYLMGDPTEALVQLGQMVDNLRGASDDDPMKAWANAQIDRITDHQQKESWTDGFDRKKLINDWRTREAYGPIVGMLDGAVRIEGVHDTSGTTLVWREYPSSLFVSLEADVWIEADSNVRAGIFISRERTRRNKEPEIISEGSISRHRDGGVQVRVQKSGTDPLLVDMEQKFTAGEWVRLRIERTGESSASRLAFSLDGIPLIEGVGMPGIGRASTPLMVGLFAEGEPGRKIDVRMDNVEVVYRR